MSELLLLFVIFVEGFVTISAEILTMRQLVPMVGNSIVVTSLIISAFLLFLAYGYQRGRKVASNDIRALKANFAKSAIWLGVGLSYMVIELFFHYFKRYVSHDSLWVLTAYLLIVTAPLVYLLGQTVPMVMNLIRSEQKAGIIRGKILHFSTIGSFFGSVLTSLFLMNYLGVGWTVFINYVLLTALVLLLFTNLKSDFLQGVFLISFVFIVYSLNVSVEEKLFVKTNAETNYKISHDDEDIYLEANGSHGSHLNKNIARPTLFEPYSYRVDNTIRTAFNRCMSVPISYTEGMSNIIYICHNDKDGKSNAPLEIYRDNLNQATLDFFRSQLDKTQGK